MFNLFEAPPALASTAVYKVEGGSGVPAQSTGASTAVVEGEVNKYLAIENLVRAYQVKY